MFTCVEQARLTPIVAARKACDADPSKDKIDLIAGAYRTEEGKPWLMPFVRKIELQLAQDPDLNHEYTWFLGIEKFTSAAPRIILGENNLALKQKRAFGIQTLSGCGALRVGAEFLIRQIKCKTVYLPDQSWGSNNELSNPSSIDENIVEFNNSGNVELPNTSPKVYSANTLVFSNTETHSIIFPNAGFTDIRYYRYWDAEKRGLNFEGFIHDLHAAPENAVILLQACCHNPTGCDPSQEQWMEIAKIMKEKHLFPFFDAAYLGFASGDVYNDAWPVRYFMDEDIELFVAVSFSKNLGLYSERIGSLIMVLADGEQGLVERIKSQLVILARSMYICPPKHGGEIVSAVLNSDDNMKYWQECLRTMVHRCRSMRQELKKCLINLGTPGNWDHITSQTGMFSFLGLTPQQVEYLAKKHHIYLLSTGRANICALNMSNVSKMAKAIHDAVVTIHD